MSVVEFAELKTLVPEGLLMALDVGSKTIGVAASDALRMLATPITTLKRGKLAADLAALAELAKKHEIRALAIGGEKRRTHMPDVPTLAELGFSGFEAEGWVGIFVPAGTPKTIVQKLSAELARIIASPEGVAGLEAVSLVPVGGTAETFESVLRRDHARWADVVKAVGVKGE